MLASNSKERIHGCIFASVAVLRGKVNDYGGSNEVLKLPADALFQVPEGGPVLGLDLDGAMDVPRARSHSWSASPRASMTGSTPPRGPRGRTKPPHTLKGGRAFFFALVLLLFALLASRCQRLPSRCYAWPRLRPDSMLAPPWQSPGTALTLR